MKRRWCLVGTAAVLIVGCASSARTATSLASPSPPASASTTSTIVEPTIAPSTTTHPTTTTVLATTTTTEAPDSGTVDIGGYLLEPSALDVRYVVLNNTNHGITNPTLHIDFLDASGQTLVSKDETVVTTLAPGDFAVDQTVVPAAPGVADIQAALADARITVVDATKVRISPSPVTFEDLRAVPASAIAGGGTVALGTLVNNGDVDQDIAPIHALALDASGRADPLDLTDATWLTRIKPGERLPFALHTSKVGIAAENFRVSISSAPSATPSAVQFAVSSLSAFIGPASEDEGSEEDNLQVVGELTNTGSSGFSSPEHTGMCVVRDSAGTIIDLSPTLSWSNRGAGELLVELATDIEPGTAAPFACGDFDAAMASPLPTDLAAYTTEAIFTPDAFTPATPPADVTLISATPSASFKGNEVFVTVTFSNALPQPHAAGGLVRVYDDTTGQLLSFAEQGFIEVVNGNGRYNIGPGETKSMIIDVNVPPGTTADRVRIESSIELTPASSVG